MLRDTWQIHSIDDSTVSTIKQKAKNRGLKVGEYLDFKFGDGIEYSPKTFSQAKRTVRLTMAKDSFERLVEKAKKEGYGVSKYLERLVE